MPQQEEILLVEAENDLDTLPQNNRQVPSTYASDRYKIDYGKIGFETFHINLEPRFVGRSVSVKFELINSVNAVYIDNVAFKSKHLKLSNPTEARNFTIGEYQENYLIEKPQYSLSFNKTRNTPNWVSWTLNPSWLGYTSRPSMGFAVDPDLDKTQWYQLYDSDFALTEQVEKSYTYNRYTNYKGSKEELAYFWPDPGHMTASGDRNRSEKDLFATFLTTNIVPQDLKSNRGLWRTFEVELQNRVRDRGDSIFISAGVYGTGGGERDADENGVPYSKLEFKDTPKPITKNPNKFKEFKGTTNTSEKIQVPSAVWKTVIGYSRDNTGKYPKLNEPTYHFALWVPNNSLEIKKEISYKKDTPQVSPKSSSWKDFTISIQELEDRLNRDSDKPDSFEYEFLSSKAIKDGSKKENIKRNKKDILNTANLLAANNFTYPVITPLSKLTIPNTSIGQNSILENSIVENNSLTENKTFDIIDYPHISSSKVNSSQISFGEIGLIKPSKTEVSLGQVSAKETSLAQTSATQINFPHISLEENSLIQNSSTQIGSTQVGIIKTSSPQIGITQVSPTQGGFFKMSILQV